MTEAAVLRAMERKDPVLFSSLRLVPFWEIVPKWKAKYPDDFPMGGQTAVDDASATKPNPPGKP